MKKMEALEELKTIEIEGNNIKNVNHMIAVIQNINPDNYSDAFHINEYLEQLLVSLRNNSELRNNERVFIAELQKKQYELKQKVATYEQEQQTNSETLKQMQERNEDLKKLQIIETRNIDNDSRANIDYLTFDDGHGNIQVLECASRNELNKYIDKFSDPTHQYTAEEIFNYLKNYIHVALNFDNAYEFEEKNPISAARAVVKEDTAKADELAQISKFKEENGLTEEPEQTIDSYGERLYRIEGYILKFKTVGDHRELVILSKPNKELLETDDLLRELEADSEEFAADYRIETSNSTTVKENDAEARILSEEEYDNLLMRLINYDETLSPEEMSSLAMTTNTYMDIISNNINNGVSTNKEVEMVGAYMEYIRPQIDDMEAGFANNTNITSTQIAQFNRFESLETQIEKLREEEERKRANSPESVHKVKTLELIPDTPQNRGLASIVILVEIAAIGAIVLYLISIAH